MIVRAAEWDDPAGAALRDAQRDELDTRYGADTEPGPKPTADDITVFYIAWDGDAAIGCGGLRHIEGTVGEIKRMYVVPGNRGTGTSIAILETLENDARARGWTRLQLETGIEQPDAMRFYEREGYTSIPRYGHYVRSEISRCYAKDL